LARQGTDWQARHGQARRGKARHGEDWQARQGEARPGEAGRGKDWQAIQQYRLSTTCGERSNLRRFKMVTTARATNTESISILEVEKATMDFHVLGTSPLIMNRMSQKVWHELLAPKGKKTAADKASTLKHDPIKEFRDAPYRMENPNSPSLLGILPTAFKRAMGTAALDMPGAKKAQILRLIYIEGEMLPVFGIPKVFMAITRSADMNKTPDVRTRAILPEWACKISVTFTKPIMREQSIANLLAAAGLQSGVGDWRQEKGSGSYGAFKIVGPDDEDFNRIVQTQAREAQEDALLNPIAHNDETSEMLSWFDVEISRRGFKVVA
jgi:hypothetical protein